MRCLVFIRKFLLELLAALLGFRSLHFSPLVGVLDELSETLLPADGFVSVWVEPDSVPHCDVLSEQTELIDLGVIVEVVLRGEGIDLDFLLL